MDAVTITDVQDYSENGIRPVLADFQNGRLDSTNVQHKIYSKNQSTVLNVETKFSYKGVVKPDRFFNSFLVVVKNGEATLIPADNAVLAPDIKVNEESEKDEPDDYFSAVRSLKKEFGSKRTKLLAQQEERMRMNTKNTTKSLEEAVAAMDVDENDLETTTETPEASYIPQINRDADRVQDVYNLNNLVPRSVLNSLDENVLNDEIYSVVHTDLVKSLLEKKLRAEMTETIEEHCKILLVLDCILHFLTLPLKVVGNKKYVPCEYSQQLSKYILETFMLPGRTGRNRSSSMKDKAMCYCIVLLAIVNKFQVDLNELCTALKMKVNKLQSIAKLLAFVSASTKDRTSVVLKLPLPAPVKNLAHTPRRRR